MYLHIGCEAMRRESLLGREWHEQRKAGEKVGLGKASKGYRDKYMDRHNENKVRKADWLQEVLSGGKSVMILDL